MKEAEQKALKFFNLRAKNVEELKWDGPLVSLTTVQDFAQVLGPDAKELGTLTPPREFNLMFKTIVGALSGEEDAAFLRPETAQGIFVNFKNVVDSSRVTHPVRHRPDRQELPQRDHAAQLHLPLARVRADGDRVLLPSERVAGSGTATGAIGVTSWYLDLGLAGERLRLREHDAGRAEPLLRAARPTSNTPSRSCRPASSANWKASPTAATSTCAATWKASSSSRATRSSSRLGPDGKPKHKGSGKDLSLLRRRRRRRRSSRTSSSRRPGRIGRRWRSCARRTARTRCRTRTASRPERVVLKLHPRLAPIKAAVFPLVNKDGMPEIAQKLYRELKRDFNVFYDDGGAVGRRYRRQDEAGTPYCFTIDGQTLQDQTVTIRDRDTLQQRRLPLDGVADELRKLLR